MTKQHFIALADMIRKRNHNAAGDDAVFTFDHVILLADFCQSQNPQFNRARWIDYVMGKCGPNGGKL